MRRKKYYTIFFLYFFIKGTDTIAAEPVRSVLLPYHSTVVNSYIAPLPQKTIRSEENTISLILSYDSLHAHFKPLAIERNVSFILPLASYHFNAKGLFEFSIPVENNAILRKIRIIRYNEKIYPQAYSIYLQNNNIQAAYAVASAAVAQRPDNKFWRERLAESAIWSDQAAIALDQYLYLAMVFNDENDRQKGQELAKKLKDDKTLIRFLAIDIKNGNHSTANWQDYVNAMLRLGDIKKLLLVLSKHQKDLTPAFYLESLSRIYKLSDDPDMQLGILERYVAMLGITPSVAEQMAQIYLNKGHISPAFAIMEQARSKAASKDTGFWTAYANVAWLANREKDELYAYQQLLKDKDMEKDVYSNLIDLASKKDPGAAYRYALNAKNEHPDSYALADSTFSLMTKKDDQVLDFPKVLAATPASVRKLLNFNNNFWNARAKYWQYIGNRNEVIQTYLNALKFLPQDNYLKADFLYFLIESNDLALLKPALSLWQSTIPSIPALWSPYAEGYARLNKRDMSARVLSLYYDQFENNKNNPYWLIAFRDALDNSDFPKQADEMTQYAWPIYLGMLKNQKEAPDYSQLLNYVKLSMTQAAGDPTAIALSQLQWHENKDVELLMLTWALSQNNSSLPKAVYWHFLARGIEPPAWATLSIALNRHDRQLMYTLLSSKKAIVSFRDRIRAATEIDAIPLAQTLAYRELKKHRQDQDLYDNFFTPLMLKTSRSLTLGQEYFQYGNVEGPRTITDFTYFISPGVSLTPYNSIWFLHELPNAPNSSGNVLTSTSNQALGTVPPHDERAGVKISALQRRGYLNADLGYRNEVASFMTAKLARTYTAFSDLNLTGSLGYNQQADDTVGLLIGGMKNDASLGFEYRILNKDSLFGTFTQNMFYTQDGQRVAEGSQGTLRYEHKFWKTYPDWTLSPYGVITRYYDKTSSLLTGNILKLVPEGTIPNQTFLIPADNTEYGLTLSFGQSLIEDYSHRWRPFSSLTLSNNSVVGFGKLYNLGIAGTVIGRDHLLLYYEWGSNQGQGLQTERLIKINYRVYL